MEAFTRNGLMAKVWEESKLTRIKDDPPALVTTRSFLVAPASGNLHRVALYSRLWGNQWECISQ